MKKIFLSFFAINSIMSCNTKTDTDYIKRGKSKAAIEDYKGAIADYDTALIQSPESVIAHYHRGNAKFALEDYMSAIADYDTAIGIDSSFTGIYNQRAVAKATLAALMSKLLSVQRPLEDISSHQVVVAMKALTDSTDEKDYYISAIADFTKSIMLDSTDTEIYIARGITKGDLQDYRGAIEDFSKAIEINPNCKEAFYHRGYIKIYLKEKESGCLDLSKAGELGYKKAYEEIIKKCN